MISDWALLQSYIEIMRWFIWALLLFSLIFYAHKAGPSWFLLLCKVARVLRGLPAILAFRICVFPAYLFGLCYDMSLFHFYHCTTFLFMLAIFFTPIKPQHTPLYCFLTYLPCGFLLLSLNYSSYISKISI